MTDPGLPDQVLPDPAGADPVGLDQVVPQRADDDSDVGWGERTSDAEDDGRLLDDRPPHHSDRA